MNTTHLTILATILLLSVSGMAQAGERSHYRGYERQGGYVTSGHYRPQSRNRHSTRHYFNHHEYPRYRYRHHGNRHDLHKGLKVVAGALVLGSIIHAVNNNHRERVIYRTRVPVSQGGYWYRVDTDGQCVEVTLNSQGQEVWTYTDPSYCY